ncbi:MAG: hypothetical protein ACYSOD_00165 [Planctomycetota bacterium]|jgi:lipopolysaccharide export LptBFGC system permease protein LptF
MKILDRYVAKNFLYGYFISLFVMIGMFLTIDLFMNLDEFAELLGVEDATGHVLTLTDVMLNVVHFYGVRCALWYKDMAGMIIVIAAVFSLTRMTRSNELVAVMASNSRTDSPAVGIINGSDGRRSGICHPEIRL